MEGDLAISAEREARIDPAPGYRSEIYAGSFSASGEIFPLPRSGGWLLERRIPGTDRTDATGLYPLFCCHDWSAIATDLAALDRDWVSLSLVADPLGDYRPEDLAAIFDRVTPYKEHFIADTRIELESFVSKSHRQNARRALRKMNVAHCPDPLRYLEDWVAAYDVLIGKHDITGTRAFSREVFQKQLATPGMTMFRASHGEETLGLDLWYVDGDVAQGHLAAFTADGYRMAASYATKWTLLNQFREWGVRWVNFGGLPGVQATGGGGLEHFKRGWSNLTRNSYICGSVLDPDTYGRLSSGKRATNFFPRYRFGDS
ncbi:MAG: GNAT family N-acetyltransferase [Silicimonas sp.]|nr:GNAT family N-acetyltransferase [Silicimonas sp.]